MEVQDDTVIDDLDPELALIENASRYLLDKTYPPESTKNEKRSIRRKSKKLVIRDGDVMYKRRNGKEVRLILSKDEHKKILMSCHGHVTSGHMGMKRTLARITERFIWPGVSKEVKSLVGRLTLIRSNARDSCVSLEDIKSDMMSNLSVNKAYTSCIAKIENGMIHNDSGTVTDMITEDNDTNDIAEISSDNDECFTKEEIHEKSPIRKGLLIPDFEQCTSLQTNSDDIYSSDKCWGEEYYFTGYPKLEQSEDDQNVMFTREFIRKTIKENEFSLRQIYHEDGSSYFKASDKFRDDFWPIELFDMAVEIQYFLKGLEMDIFRKPITFLSDISNNVVWPEILTLLIMKKFQVDYNTAVNCVLTKISPCV